MSNFKLFPRVKIQQELRDEKSAKESSNNKQIQQQESNIDTFENYALNGIKNTTNTLSHLAGDQHVTSSTSWETSCTSGIANICDQLVEKGNVESLNRFLWSLPATPSILEILQSNESVLRARKLIATCHERVKQQGNCDAMGDPTYNSKMMNVADYGWLHRTQAMWAEALQQYTGRHGAELRHGLRGLHSRGLLYLEGERKCVCLSAIKTKRLNRF